MPDKGNFREKDYILLTVRDIKSSTTGEACLIEKLVCGEGPYMGVA